MFLERGLVEYVEPRRGGSWRALSWCPPIRRCEERHRRTTYIENGARDGMMSMLPTVFMA